MRQPLLPLVLLLSACGGDGAVLRGSFREDALLALGADSLFVQVEGGERVAVRGGSFEIPDLPAGAVRLRAGSGDEEARIDLRDVPEGAALALEGIRVDRESGLAFPSAVRLEGGKTVVVNGIRRASPDALPATVSADGVVLAASGSGDALLFRPADTSLPDLRVVVTPTTEATTTDGDPVSAEVVSDGDSLRLEGGTEGGYVVARRLVLPRGTAVREAKREDRREGDGARGRDEDGGEERPTARRESGGEAPAPRAREDRGGDGPGRGKGRGKGREKEKGGGKGKGKGKG